MNCNNCGDFNESDACFCAQCGAPLGAPQTPENAQDNMAIQGQPFPQQFPPVYTPQPVKKGLKSWQIPLIILAVLFVFFAFMVVVGIASEWLDQDGGSSSGGDFSIVDDGPELPYDNGEIIGNVYINEWADLQLTLPEGYTVVSSEEVGLPEEQLGFYLRTPSGKTFQLIFDDISGNPSISEEQFLEASLQQMQKELSGILATIYPSDEYRDVLIAGKTFSSTDMRVDYGEYYLIANFYVRKIDNKMCSILVFGESIEENDEAVSQFTPAH